MASSHQPPQADKDSVEAGAPTLIDKDDTEGEVAVAVGDASISVGGVVDRPMDKEKGLAVSLKFDDDDYPEGGRGWIVLFGVSFSHSDSTDERLADRNILPTVLRFWWMHVRIGGSRDHP